MGACVVTRCLALVLLASLCLAKPAEIKKRQAPAAGSGGGGFPGPAGGPGGPGSGVGFGGPFGGYGHFMDDYMDDYGDDMPDFPFGFPGGMSGMSGIPPWWFDFGDKRKKRSAGAREKRQAWPGFNNWMNPTGGSGSGSGFMPQRPFWQLWQNGQGSGSGSGMPAFFRHPSMYDDFMDDVPAIYEYYFGNIFDDFGDTKKKRSTTA